jgi:hypothetical protein
VATFTKDPDAVLDYGFDWSRWLADGETITASTWEADDEGITIDDGTQFTDTTASVWLSGGTTGAFYRLTNHVTTSDGREDDRTHTISVRER